MVGVFYLSYCFIKKTSFLSISGKGAEEQRTDIQLIHYLGNVSFQFWSSFRLSVPRTHTQREIVRRWSQFSPLC